MPPVLPMLAKAVKELPLPEKHADDTHPGLLYEPKWDGFRCIIFRDGDEIELASRNTKSLAGNFPEIFGVFRGERLPRRAVPDGELIVAIGDSLDFDRLQERIHPADSRVRMLAETTPAAYVAFDLLAVDDESLVQAPLAVRRTRLERTLGETTRSGGSRIHLTRVTTD